MKLVQIKQDWPKDRLLVNYAIHNVCNYKCWYCFPESNSGEYTWPDIDIATSNLIHLLQYYKTHLGKKQFELHLLGGEPTLWPKLGTFAQRLKTEFGNNIQIEITSNGSRTLRWWEENGKYFDKVLLSCHPNEADAYHIKDVADLLYKLPVYVDVTVLMDPTMWNQAIEMINVFKTSKKRWSIQTSEVIHDKVVYTIDQQKYLKKYLKRMPNLLWSWKHATHYNYKTKVQYDNGKVTTVKKNYLLINKLNYFEGWECNVGVDNITINFTGNISASCRQTLYGLNFDYNLYQPDFINNFNPSLVPVTCSKYGCYCEHEFNTSKRIIPLKVI